MMVMMVIDGNDRDDDTDDEDDVGACLLLPHTKHSDSAWQC